MTEQALDSYFNIHIPVKPYVKAFMEREFLPDDRKLHTHGRHSINILIYSLLDNRNSPFMPHRERSKTYITYFISPTQARLRKACILGKNARKQVAEVMYNHFKKATYDHVLYHMTSGATKNDGLVLFRERYAITEEMYPLRSHIQALDRMDEPLPMKLNRAIRTERLDRMYYEVRMMHLESGRTMLDCLADFYKKYPDTKEIMTEHRARNFIYQYKQIRGLYKEQTAQA